MPPTPVATATRRRNASSSDAAKKKDKKQASEKKQVSEPASEEETELLSKLQALVDDGSSVRGREKGGGRKGRRTCWLGKWRG